MKNQEIPCKRFEVVHKIITALVGIPIIILGFYYFFNEELTDKDKSLPLLAAIIVFISYASIYEIKCKRPHFFEFFRLRREMKAKEKT